MREKRYWHRITLHENDFTKEFLYDMAQLDLARFVEYLVSIHILYYFELSVPLINC